MEEEDDGVDFQHACERQGLEPWEDEAYFESYSSLSLHRDMVGDVPRNEAFRAGIADTVDEGDVVVDVGCGTGLLSFFAADAGASRVVGCDMSSVVWYAHKIASEGKYKSVCFFTKQRAEDLDLQGQRVNVLISEWIGSFLFFESMLESVLVARDKFKPERMAPSGAALYFAPVDASALLREKVGFWDDVSGIDMGVIGRALLAELAKKPIHDFTLDAGAVVAKEKRIAEFDILTMDIEDIEKIECEESVFVITKDAVVHGFAVWFDLRFCGGSVLSTSPDSPATHWNQEVLLLDEAIECSAGDEVEASISVVRNKYWRRHFYIVVEGQTKETRFKKIFPHHRWPSETQKEETSENQDSEEDLAEEES